MEDFSREWFESLWQKPLNEIIKEGAHQLVKMAVRAEFEAFLAMHSQLQDEQGRAAVVRNGHNPEREFVTNAGVMKVRVPRVRDRRTDEAERVVFRSALLPPYLRRSRDMNDLIPFLYLKGISTSAFEQVLSHIVGEKVELSANTVVRLKEKWEKEYATWAQRDLRGKRYIYFWADGVYFNVRLEGGRNCILVVMGVTEDGRKELVAVADGMRESELSWQELLLDLRKRGLEEGPFLAIGDGALGFWNALCKVYPETRQQRCWVHKTANVLDKLPKAVQREAKHLIHQIYLAESKEEALTAFARFEEQYARFEKAVNCLVKDKEETLAFYDFPREHWKHIRSTNPIESAFSTVRLRTYKTKGCGTREATLTMVFKLAQAAENGWNKLHCYNLLPLLASGVKFVNGVMHAA
jgi:transposase-like protein